MKLLRPLLITALGLQVACTSNTEKENLAFPKGANDPLNAVTPKFDGNKSIKDNGEAQRNEAKANQEERQATLEAKIRSQKTDLNKLMVLKAKLATETSELQNSISSLSDKIKESSKGIKGADKSSEIKKAEYDLKAKTRYLNESENQLIAKKEQLKGVTDKRIALKEEWDNTYRITKWIREKVDSEDTYLNHDAPLLAESAELKREITNLESQISKYKIAVEDAKKALQQVRDSLSQAQEQNAKALNQLKEDKASIEKLNAQLATSNEQLVKIESQITELNQDLQNSEAELKAISNTESGEDNETVAETTNALKAKIIEKIKKGEKITRSEIIKALQVEHQIAKGLSATEVEKVSEVMLELVKEDASMSVGAFKDSYENKLAQTVHNGEELIYNSNSFNYSDPVLTNRVQCYSGTLNLLMLNDLRALPFKHTVVIFTDGHVLPGYIEIKNNKFVLKGVETTAAGEATVDYGVTSSIEGRIRVFSADQFLLFELLKSDMNNLSEVYKQMQDFMKNYGFNPKNFFSGETSVDATASSQLNSTMLGFGVSNENGTDKKRSRFSKKSNNKFQKKKTTGVGSTRGAVIERPEEFNWDPEKLPECTSIDAKYIVEFSEWLMKSGGSEHLPACIVTEFNSAGKVTSIVQLELSEIKQFIKRVYAKKIWFNSPMLYPFNSPVLYPGEYELSEATANQLYRHFEKIRRISTNDLDEINNAEAPIVMMQNILKAVKGKDLLLWEEDANYNLKSIQLLSVEPLEKEFSKKSAEGN